MQSKLYRREVKFLNIRQTHRAILKFNTDTGGIARISIPRADVSKTADNARDSMEAIINTGIVRTSGGDPVSVRGAEILTTTRTNIVTN